MAAWGDVPTWLLVAVGAVGGGAALRQLGLQRTQLRDQQEVIRAQTQLLQRQQADQVDVATRLFDGVRVGAAGQIHMVVVTNNSARPIREVACQIDAIPAEASVRIRHHVTLYGELVPLMPIGPEAQDEAFEVQERGDTMPVLRAGHKAGFVWDVPNVLYPRIIPWARFTDDAGLHWEITADLHLKKLDRRDW
jgi:hypothetical protein